MSILDVTAAPHPRFPVQGGLLLAAGDALIHSSMMVTMSSSAAACNKIFHSNGGTPVFVQTWKDSLCHK